MDRELTVAGVQLNIKWEDPKSNFRSAEAWIRQAADRGARLVVLPEMFATGFSMASDHLTGHADAIREFVRAQAVRHGVWLIAGLAARDGGVAFNEAALFAPDGAERLSYRKIHPFTLAGEDKIYGAGEDVVTTSVDGVRVTPLICYDLRFTELFRSSATDTDLFVVVANWPDRRSHAWRILLQARAIDCQAWVLGVNRVGKDGNEVPHRGDTALVEPMGDVVADLAWDEGVVSGTVDPGRVSVVRDRYPFLADRRPDVYGRLGRKTED
jgi:predicted amidohydrolase